jgi:hypothetical protein
MEFCTEWRLGYNDMHGYETETHIGRYIGRNQWLMPFIGFDWRYKKIWDQRNRKNIWTINTKDNRSVVSKFYSSLVSNRVFNDGNVRSINAKIFQFQNEYEWLLVYIDKEYMAGLKYSRQILGSAL